MTLRISAKTKTNVPVEVEGVTPDVCQPLTLDAIRRLEAFHGNERTELGQLFDVEGDAGDEHLVFEGDCAGVHWIGAKMKSGRIEVRGTAGRHLGSEMEGGSIDVEGDAGDWVGGEMKKGRIHVRGRAGHLVGAAYRGSARGMTGGTIMIEGDAGNEIGHTMRRGLIAVRGNVGDLVGFNMLAGSILLFGETGIRHGAGMHRGTLGFFGKPPELLPSFRFACRCRPQVLTLLDRFLAQQGMQTDSPIASSDCDLFHGDMIEGGRGEVFIRRN